MEKSLPLTTTTHLQEFGKIISSSTPSSSFNRHHRLPKQPKPTPRNQQVSAPPPDSVKVKLKMEGQGRLPLAAVVSDCVKRWFEDTLKEAKAGDSSMQVLVGQMYCSGYGVPRDEQKGHAWMTRASRSRDLESNVRGKPPGYNAGDSDSDEKD